MKKIIIWGNNIFVPVEYRTHLLDTNRIMYMQGTVSGLLFANSIYSEEEVQKICGLKAKQAEDFMDVNRAYNL